MRAILGGVGLPCVPARPACCCCRLLRTACGARRKENPAAREWCDGVTAEGFKQDGITSSHVLQVHTRRRN